MVEIVSQRRGCWYEHVMSLEETRYGRLHWTQLSFHKVMTPESQNPEAYNNSSTGEYVILPGGVQTSPIYCSSRYIDILRTQTLKHTVK
jgi:hypothetical protein